MITAIDDPMLIALGASSADPERAEKMMLFGQFVGAWDLDVAFFDRAGRETKRYPAEWIFGWVLGGRAIQDVLIAPPREHASAPPPATTGTGSTLRYYDPKLDAWRVVFVGASSNEYAILTGRAVGDRIVLDGQEKGEYYRWQFSEITRDRFLWTGHISDDEGRTWWKEQEMVARRRGAL
jgi:hypothetical protein